VPRQIGPRRLAGNPLTPRPSHAALKPEATIASQANPFVEVIAIGAGFAGLGLIHHVREAGLSIRVFDKATDVGGTWTWNRYPGAATDSEGDYSCRTFSKEILNEWTWSER
jgi:cyclohexanone monooxygenase